MRLGHFQRIVWTPGLRELASRHRHANHDFIAVHDLFLLPVALAIRSRGRVLFDARESGSFVVQRALLALATTSADSA